MQGFEQFWSDLHPAGNAEPAAPSQSRLLHAPVSLGGGASFEKKESKPNGFAVGIEEPATVAPASKKKQEEAKAHLKIAKKMADEQDRWSAWLGEERAVHEHAAYERTLANGLRWSVVTMENFSVSHPLGGTDILTNVVIHLVPGGRYGLVGRNGLGKSSLLRAMSTRKVCICACRVRVGRLCMRMDSRAGPWASARLVRALLLARDRRSVRRHPRPAGGGCGAGCRRGAP